MEDTRQQADQTHFFRWALVVLLGLAFTAAVFAAGFVTGTGLEATGLFGTAGDVPVVPLTIETQDEAPEDVEMDIFWEVWNTLENRFYYDLPAEDERVEGAIQGLVESLDDPYTAYVPPQIADILREDETGEFEGIGAFVEEAPDGGVQIIRVFEDGPADEAGLQAGDIIIAVDGTDVTDMILNEALLLIRGEAGTDVDLTVFRQDETDLLEFTVTRARLAIPTVETQMLDDNIGYLALFQFNAISSREVRSAVDELLDEGAEAIIFDLRNNPGGFLDEAITVSDLFLPRSLVLVERTVDGDVEEFTADTGDLGEDVPLVVLINENSASASEIVAAAIQDNERGTLVGQTTFGKGSVQLLYNLSNGSQLRVTYANWFTPDDVSISENGVVPDIIVETADDEVGTGDLQLERAIEFLQDEMSEDG